MMCSISIHSIPFSFMETREYPRFVVFSMIDGASRPQPLLSRGFRSYAFNRSQVARTYFRQIVRAISYCHRLHVVHRDLKPENVVFFEKLGTVKLTDFGFSNRFCPGQKLETSCGSLAYSAPEILLGDSYDAPAVGEYDNIDLFLYLCRCFR